MCVSLRQPQKTEAISSEGLLLFCEAQVRSRAGGRGRGGQEESGLSWRREKELSGGRGPLSDSGRAAHRGGL